MPSKTGGLFIAGSPIKWAHLKYLCAMIEVGSDSENLVDHRCDDPRTFTNEETQSTNTKLCWFLLSRLWLTVLFHSQSQSCVLFNVPTAYSFVLFARFACSEPSSSRSRDQGLGSPAESCQGEMVAGMCLEFDGPPKPPFPSFSQVRKFLFSVAVIKARVSMG